jgi:hypothetical protein
VEDKLILQTSELSMLNINVDADQIPAREDAMERIIEFLSVIGVG